MGGDKEEITIATKSKKHKTPIFVRRLWYVLAGSGTGNRSLDLLFTGGRHYDHAEPAVEFGHYRLFHFSPEYVDSRSGLLGRDGRHMAKSLIRDADWLLAAFAGRIRACQAPRFSRAGRHCESVPSASAIPSSLRFEDIIRHVSDSAIDEKNLAAGYFFSVLSGRTLVFGNSIA